ncbi:transcription factor Ouib isoform X2 [Drosophila willistoni]|uniref:transcription factor Ouib isoform X2 n=1 Tax=Drosophila willistoni TaxID=7260 RepID=UPI000C26C400|nr:transcription factor Ouib isoform X2 [Drosophila willistoni]
MLQNVCRVCSRRTDDKTAQSLFVTKAHKLISQINLLTGIVLEPADDLPDLICPMCQKNLKRFIGFRKLCLRSQKKFENHREVKCVVKPQNRAADTHIVCVRRSGRKQNQLEQHETGDTYMKEEPIEVLIKVEHTQDINNDKVEEVDTLDDDIDRLDTTSNNSKHAEKDKEFISLSDEDEEKWLTDEEEDELYLPPAHTLPKRRRHRHQDKTSSEKPPKNLPVFFCDQCGHNVTGKTNFDRHIRKHSGIRPFQCQLCPSRFLSAGELKGHQM